MPKISFVTGTIDLDSLIDNCGVNLFDTYCMSESLFDIFCDCDTHLWESLSNPHDDSIRTAYAEVEDSFPKYSRVSYYREQIDHDLKSAHCAAYRDSVENYYCKAIESHIEGVLASLHAKGFKAYLIDKKGNECPLYEAGEIYYAISKKSFIENFKNSEWTSMFDNTGTRLTDYYGSIAEMCRDSDDIIEHFIGDLDILDWSNIDYYGSCGDYSTWKYHFDAYEEATTTMRNDFSRRLIVLKELIKSNVSLIVRRDILQRQFQGVR